MALLALLRLNLGLFIADLDFVAFFQSVPEVRVLMGQRRSVAQVTVLPLGRWMAVARYLPGGQPVAFAAIVAKQAGVGIQMAGGAHQVGM